MKPVLLVSMVMECLIVISCCACMEHSAIHVLLVRLQRSVRCQDKVTVEHVACTVWV